MYSHMLLSQPVIEARIPAGPSMNTAPTRIIITTANSLITCFVVIPRYLPIISGRLAPLWLRLITPAMKSCIAPMKMPPRVIHRKATGP